MTSSLITKFSSLVVITVKKTATCAQEDATKTNPEDKKDESFDADSYEFSAYLDKKEGLLSD